MDSLTQCALGAAVAEAGFGDRLGPKAAAVGALAALVPDLDMAVRLFGDEWTMLVHHRGLTHSLVAAPALAAALGAAGWAWAGRSGGVLRWMHLALWALVTHSLLDWCTSYGTMLFYPLSSHRFALDAVAIVDPLYSLPLFAGLAVAILRRRRGLSGRACAALTLIGTTLYLIVGLALTLRAERLARREFAHEGFQASHIRAFPHLLAWPLRRVAAVDAGGNIRTGAVSPFHRGVMGVARFERPDHPLLARALASEKGRIMEWFSDGLLSARIEPSEGGTTVYLTDQRYGFVSAPEFSPFQARFDFDARGELTSVSLARSFNRPFGTEAAASFRFLMGRTP